MTLRLGLHDELAKLVGKWVHVLRRGAIDGAKAVDATCSDAVLVADIEVRLLAMGPVEPEQLFEAKPQMPPVSERLHEAIARLPHAPGKPPLWYATFDGDIDGMLLGHVTLKRVVGIVRLPAFVLHGGLFLAGGCAGVRTCRRACRNSSRRFDVHSADARSWPLSPVWGILARAMARSRKTIAKKRAPAKLAGYDGLVADVAEVIEEARGAAARSVNVLITATYWLVGRRLVEAEQAGETRAEYGKELVERLSADLTARVGRGFGRRNLFQMRTFYLAYRDIVQTPSALSGSGVRGQIVQTLSAQFGTIPPEVVARLRLPWSHYVRLLAVKNENARAFYEDEALRGGWTVRQLDRQIQS